MISNHLAQFVVDTNFEDLPIQVVEKTKICFLDFLGVSLAGFKGKSSKIINELLNSPGSSSIIGGGVNSPLDASLANGVAAHSMDLDDGHRRAQLHPGACVFPAALALAEKEKLDGGEFVTSAVVGYQVAIELGIMVNPEHRMRGFHSTGTCGTFGAGAAASKALNLDMEGVVNALGLAGTQAAGLLESDHKGSMAKHLHAGKAAQGGLLSALLSQKGFTGADSIIDGEEGFLRAMGPLNYDNKILNDDFHIKGVYIKKYPICRHLHSSVDAALALMQEESLSSDDISSMEVKTYKIAAEHDNYNPDTVEAMRQSLPMCLALAVSQGNFDKISYFDDKLLELASNISIDCDPELEADYPDKRPSVLTIITKKGYSFEKKVELPFGEPEHPFLWEDVIDKFRKLNPEYDVKKLDIIKEMESYSVNELMNILNQ